MLTAVDALRNPEKVQGNTVIIGGGLTGIEIAYDQALQGNIVTVLEAMDKILNVDVSAANLKLLYAELKYYKIPIMVCVGDGSSATSSALWQLVTTPKGAARGKRTVPNYHSCVTNCLV